MSQYVEVFEIEEYGNLSIVFHCEQDRILAIGEKMEAQCEEAYMNGYNWDAFFYAYLEKNAPELLEELESDPESGAYFARYPLSDEGRQCAEAFKNIIIDLVENEQKIYDFLAENADEIEWD